MAAPGATSDVYDCIALCMQGKLVGIAGPFSSGKTSLIRALLGQVVYVTYVPALLRFIIC